MVLRIERPLRGHRDFTVHEGLTIGSDPICEVFLDAPEVRGLHATVAEGAQGLKIRCSFGASLGLPDGSPFTELYLAPGLTFFIADATCRFMELWQVEAEEAAETPPEPDPLDDVSIPPVIPCPRCGWQLGIRVLMARFCPRCGTELMARAMRQRLPLSNSAPYFEADGPLIHSEMLTGYANALHRLGRMYERGQGVLRNEREAVRCFYKAAMLGNARAQQKLGERGLGLGAGSVRE